MQTFPLIADKMPIKTLPFVCSGHIDIKRKTFGLSREAPCVGNEPHISKAYENTTGVFALQDEADGEPKVCFRICFHNDSATAKSQPSGVYQKCV